MKEEKLKKKKATIKRPISFEPAQLSDDLIA